MTQYDPRGIQDDPSVTQDDHRVIQDDPWVTQGNPRVTQGNPRVTQDDLRIPRMTPSQPLWLPFVGVCFAFYVLLCFVCFVFCILFCITANCDIVRSRDVYRWGLVPYRGGGLTGHLFRLLKRDKKQNQEGLPPNNLNFC